MFDRRLPIAGVLLLLQLAACDDAASGDDPTTTTTSSSGGGGASSSSNGGAQAQGGSSQGGSAEGGSTQGGSGVGGAPSVFLSVTVDGATRTYWRMVPNNYDPNQPHGLVVVLHGSGGSGQTAYEKFKLQNQGAGQFIFLYPDALPAASGEPRWETEMDSVDYAFFDAIVAKAEEDLCIDRDRLFVTGFSLGARFTSMLGCFRGDVIRAIAPGAPGMNAASLPLVAETDAGHCRGEVGAWVFWGTQDPDHQAGAELVRDYYSATNGCDATRTPLASPAECEAYDNCPVQRPVTWCTYTLNHQWPDGQNVDYNGQKAAMDFFKSFPTPYLP
jgi:polyhydroxybutyrate depolymerase